MPKEQNKPATAPQRQESIEILLVINALLALVENFLPKLKQIGGENITVEEQAAVRARYDKLQGDMDAAFGGSHWRIRPDPVPPQS